MSIEALPCLLCHRPLRNVWQDAENQPSDGVVCDVPGNYGSTVWDPMTGARLEFNLCDDCLRAAGEAGLISVYRRTKPVIVSGPKADIAGGWQEVPYLPLTWNPDVNYEATDDELLRLDVEDVIAGNVPTSVHIEMQPEVLAWLAEEELQ